MGKTISQIQKEQSLAMASVSQVSIAPPATYTAGPSLESKEAGVSSPNIYHENFFIITRLVQMLVYPISRFVLWWLRVDIVDRHKTLRSLDGNVIFAASHFSEVDILLLPAIFRPFSKHFPIRYFTFETKFYKTQIAGKNKLKRFFYGGWLFRLCGSCEYDRTKKKYPYHVKLADHIDLLKRLRQTLLIYPSGSIYHDGSVPKVLPGGAALSYYSGRSVLPLRVVVSGRFTLGNIIRRKVKMKFIVGKQLSRSDLFPKLQFVSFDTQILAKQLQENEEDLLRATNTILEVFNELTTQASL